MIDSSYVNAADPNTMRTFGPVRNSVYNFRFEDQLNSGRPESETTTEKEMPQSLRSGYDFNTIVRANDYTKNLSSSIFTPGLVDSYQAEVAVSVQSSTKAKSAMGHIPKKSDKKVMSP